jgi:hypothetical protein
MSASRRSAAYTETPWATGSNRRGLDPLQLGDALDQRRFAGSRIDSHQTCEHTFDVIRLP